MIGMSNALKTVALHNLKFNGLKYVIKNINYKASTFFCGTKQPRFFQPTQVGVVIVVVCVAVFCILGGGIGVVKLYRSHAAALSNFLPKQKVKTKAQKKAENDSDMKFAGTFCMYIYIYHIYK